jgi:hypothetical protein
MRGRKVSSWSLVYDTAARFLRCSGSAMEALVFKGKVEGAEGGGNVLGELGAGGGFNGCGGREAL